MNVRLDVLGRLATVATGKTCRVAIEELRKGVDGLSYYDGVRYVVSIEPILFLRRDVQRVAWVFWHECAHISLGHLLTEKHTPTAQDIRSAIEQMTILERIQMLEREVAAEAWAANVMAQVPARNVWELAVRD
ncbi:MAG: hypothetical protein ACOYBO_07735 [Azonexus sp.]